MTKVYLYANLDHVRTKVALPKLKCLRCGHEWTPRREDPRICPKCKTAWWDTPKAKPKEPKID